MKISACYIVKNEENNIGKSIASLQGMYDELIVVDTGSTDNTIAVAEKYGAQIYHFRWQNDFSKARNFALSKLKGDWIIFLDADNYYVGDVDIREYLVHIEKEYGDVDGLLLPEYDEYHRELPPSRVARIFRNCEYIRYKGAIHEVISGIGRNITLRFAQEIKLMHSGSHADIMPNKLRRNLNLLLEDIDKNGENKAYYYYIAECYFGLQEYEKAIDYIRKAIASPVRHYREEANYYHILLESMRQCNYPGEEMVEIANEAIKKFPNMPEFYGEQGIILSSIGRYDEAYKMLLKCMEKYEFTDREQNEYGYFYTETMGIIYARLARIAWLKGESEVAKLATSLAVYLSNGKWGTKEKEEISLAVKAESKQQVVICIPVYKQELSPFEKASLKQLNQVLGKYPRVFIAPESLDFDYQEYGEGISVERFPDYFFNNVSSYSALMLNLDFYQRFTQYEYMLIYQTDAFVFSDRLKEFCHMGYDYIGAPVSRFDPAWHAIDARTGNGGLSLRKISAAIRILKQWDYIMQDSPFINLFMQWEDLFWGYCGRREDLSFTVPTVKIAAEFAVQANIAHSYKNILAGWRPFGCHGWYNLNYDFWQKIIEAYGFDFSKLPYPGKEAYPRIQDYLTTRNTVNMRILWGLYRNGHLHDALVLLDDWLQQYPAGHPGWHHNMEELVYMWRTVDWDDKYKKSYKSLYLRKLAICIQRGFSNRKFYPVLWNLLVTLIPHLQKYDYAEMKNLTAAIESGWWDFWAGNACYQKSEPHMPQKKIVAMTTVTDEWPLLESFIRHTLAFADAIIIDERFATERVKDILHKLEAEGLPLIIHQKALNSKEFADDIDYVLNLNASDFILPMKSTEQVRTLLEELPAQEGYAIETGFFAPYHPYANRDKFLLARPLVRKDGIAVKTNIINIHKTDGKSMKMAKGLYAASFREVDAASLAEGIIPADTELVDVSKFIANQPLHYSKP